MEELLYNERLECAKNTEGKHLLYLNLAPVCLVGITNVYICMHSSIYWGP